jgi:tRNA-2-methylthio-N6-dimethylallyladenosine synthase
MKQDRLQPIIRLDAIYALERSQHMVGRVQEVLVEDVNKKNSLQIVGRNPYYRLVYFEGNNASLKGRIVPMPITDTRASTRDDDVLRRCTKLSPTISISIC